jgi:histone-lysine N-methyltransferase SETMAR
MKEIFKKKRRPATCLRAVRLLHYNTSSHKATIERQYLKQEKVAELPHPRYSRDLAPCDFFLFPRLKNTMLEENIKSKKSRFGHFPVSEQYTSKNL